MPKKMYSALLLFDFASSLKDKEETTEEEVKSYIRDEFGDKLALKFKPEYLHQ